MKALCWTYSQPRTKPSRFDVLPLNNHIGYNDFGKVKNAVISFYQTRSYGRERG